MKGLSVTAIGQRPIEECVDIFYQLQQLLNLDYLELAIASNCDLNQIPASIPVVIHDRCLYEKGRRLPFSLMQPETWARYKILLGDHQVLALSVHPPKLNEASIEQVVTQRQALEEFIGVPVLVEVMPSPNYWLSQHELINLPLLLDISHINIWHQGNQNEVKSTFQALLPEAQAIHLSHNDGYNDSHSLIPDNIWFQDAVDSWATTKLVTYESLPQKWHEYERLDKRRPKH